MVEENPNRLISFGSMPSYRLVQGQLGGSWSKRTRMIALKSVVLCYESWLHGKRIGCYIASETISMDYIHFSIGRL